MSSTVRFTEVETGTEVSVFTPFTWGSDVPLYHVVTYPSGRAYAVTSDQLNKHFTIVTPQEVFIRAYGTTDRPTKEQRKLEDGEAATLPPPSAAAQEG